MKRLSNISPFILLLVPVFFMMILTFATSSESQTKNNEVAVKTNTIKVVKVENILDK